MIFRRIRTRRKTSVEVNAVNFIPKFTSASFRRRAVATWQAIATNVGAAILAFFPMDAVLASRRAKAIFVVAGPNRIVVRGVAFTAQSRIALVTNILDDLFVVVVQRQAQTCVATATLRKHAARANRTATGIAGTDRSVRLRVALGTKNNGAGVAKFHVRREAIHA